MRSSIKETRTDKIMVNYQNGKIYKLVNAVDEKIYVGSPSNTLRQRKDGHKRSAKRERDKNTKVYQHLNSVGWDNVEIILIESFPCNSKDELHKKERYYIDLLKPELNKVIPTRTNKEWIKDHTGYQKKQYEKHREKHLETKKQYHQKNREMLFQKFKDYYNNNIEKHKNYQKQSIECPCGAIARKGDLARHNKTKKHQFAIQFINYLLL